MKPCRQCSGAKSLGVVVAPAYSTNPVASRSVVENLRKRGLFLIINDTMGEYRARFFDVNWSIDNWVRAPDSEKTVWAATMDEAICRAALAAIGATP